MDVNTRTESTREKKEGLTAFKNGMLNSPAAGSFYASFASENYLFKSVVFGSLCAGSGGRQLVCSDRKASTIIH